MVDLSDKGSNYDELSSKTPDGVSSEETLNQVKTCADCGTTKTPLWRGGPAGPKSLCNACGIRSRKKRRALLVLTKEDKKSKKITSPNVTTSTSNSNHSQSNHSQSDGSSTSDGDDKLGNSLKRKLVALGREVVLQRPRSTLTKQRRKLGEEEQAAMLLMALSCGSVFA